ncbi:MAG: DNA repair exonuclease [Clostridiales bacterium]|nr:DNA repair exonuclease [Clostridiales bacterium]
MLFLHTADIHLGASPDKDMPWGKERSQAIWNTFRRIISTAQKKQVDLLLIAGDFFHRQPLSSECKEVNYLFSTIPNTKVVMIAGNHDYIRDTSPYLIYPWASNVTILTSETMSSVYFEDLNVEVHGFSYHRQEITEPLYDNLHAPSDGRYHILLAHGGDDTHIPIHWKRLSLAGFHYVALGHIHQPRISQETSIAYAGSPEPMDKSDVGKRGFIMGTLDEKGCRFRWYPCASGQYHTISLTVNRDTTSAQIADTLKQKLPPDVGAIYRLTLEGFRDPEVRFDKELIQKAGRIVDVTDQTIPEYNLEHLEEEHAHDLISHYIHHFSGAEANSREEKALYYGLRALLDPKD